MKVDTRERKYIESSAEKEGAVRALIVLVDVSTSIEVHDVPLKARTLE